MTNHKGCSTRLASSQDVPILKALWKTVFGDDTADIDNFFTTYFSPDLTIVIDDGERPVSVAYILPVGQLVLPNNERLDCAMLYAIATLPEFRGRGYGEAVTQAAGMLATQKGFPAVVLKPADNSLFGFYSERSEFREFFDVFETDFDDTELPPYSPRYTLSSVSPTEYRTLRQKLLNGCVYIDFDERGLTYQRYLSAISGGGLYTITLDGESAGCAVIEQGDGIHIKELLLSKSCRMADAISAVAQLMPTKKYTVRALSDFGNREKGEYRRFGMMVPINGRLGVSSIHYAKWYGPAFD